MDCPNCGAEIVELTGLGPDDAPFACYACSRGWWPSELTPTARSFWEPETRSYAPEAAPLITAFMQADLEAAREESRSEQDA